jgi:hypothetical protein
MGIAARGTAHVANDDKKNNEQDYGRVIHD